jgi:enoyl-CoA hydratase/carnithine racemase
MMNDGQGHPKTIVSDASSTFAVKIADRAAVVEFSRGHYQNHFSQERMRELVRILRALDLDDDVGSIVLTGGEGRSFGVGGDFHEVSKFVGGDEVDLWIDNLTELYTTILGISKPVVAAIDGYAIGLGLQIALCCDYRVGSESCQLIMPELKMGIACNFGGYMLETVVGRSVMQAMLFTAEGWNAERALKDHILHEVTSANQIVSRALQCARTIGSWTSSAVQGTRPNINATYLNGIYNLAEQAKRSHRGAFSQGQAQARMEKIISKGCK